MSRSGVAARMVIPVFTPDFSSSMLLRAGLSPPCMAGSAPPWGPHRHPTLSLHLTAPATPQSTCRSINRATSITHDSGLPTLQPLKEVNLHNTWQWTAYLMTTERDQPPSHMTVDCLPYDHWKRSTSFTHDSGLPTLSPLKAVNLHPTWQFTAYLMTS